jgi:iron transport multicopper oxidase
MYLHFDQHSLTIIEVDGIYTHPRTVDSIYLAVAQRYGVLLTTKPTAARNYAALGKLDETMFDGYGDPDYPSASVIPNVNGYLVYDQTKPLPAPLELTLDQLSATLIDDFTLVPLDNMPLLQNPTQTFVLNLSFFEQDGQNRYDISIPFWQ